MTNDELNELLAATGFHDGRRRVMTRPEVSGRIDDTSKVFNYRTECSAAYHVESEGRANIAVLAHLRAEWSWADEVIKRSGFDCVARAVRAP